MRHTILILALMLGMGGVEAQQYSFTFRLDGATDSVLYIGQHFRDKTTVVDTARLHRGSYTFAGRRKWERGVYALLRQDGKTAVGDFCIDGSRRFTIEGDARLSAASVKVKGCETNSAMYAYMAVEDAAKVEMDAIAKRKKSTDRTEREQAAKEEAALIERMTEYERTTRHGKQENLYFTLLNLCEAPEVPDSVADKPTYYRMHYWDAFFDTDYDLQSTEVLHSPQLFNKVNYFFYGLMYYADSDTISATIDRLAARIGGNTKLLQYVFDHIEPRYFRSTKNIGWDAVWCHLASQYYLRGRCPWATEATLHNMRYNLNRISQSLIGAHGRELLMADTNQSSDPKDWISSHRFPNRYVILWFWDPDCHHCQEQSEELKVLYDSLRAVGNNRFEVYAIGYESDVEKWKRYVREHDFRWVNVGGTNVNIDYQEAYNVHGAPTMIILDEHRDVIMNKVLPIKGLMRFLDEHEKKQEQVGHNQHTTR